MEFATKIEVGGFKPSTDGRLGPGVYFTTIFDEAKNIAQYKYGKEGVVIESRVMRNIPIFDPKQTLEKMLKWFDKNEKYRTESVVDSIHPEWARNQEFEEVCVKDPKRIKFIKIHKL